MCFEPIARIVSDGENTLKRIFYDADGKNIILHPENAAMPDIKVKSCEIQGVAIKVLKDL